MERMQRQFVSPRQFAEITGMNANVVRRKCGNGSIPALQIGNRWMIPTSFLKVPSEADEKVSVLA